jgi:hypothetical protein
MLVSFKLRSPLGFLFARSQRDQVLTRYVVRELRRGRPLDAILADPYVVNRSSGEERSRLLERPEVVEVAGEQAIDELRHGLRAAAGTR